MNQRNIQNEQAAFAADDAAMQALNDYISLISITQEEKEKLRDLISHCRHTTRQTMKF